MYQSKAIKFMDQTKRDSSMEHQIQDHSVVKCHQISSEIAEGIVTEMLGKTFVKIDKNEAFRQTLKIFSQFKAVRNIKQISQLNTRNPNYVSQQQLSPAGSEPLPLYVDSLLPISADIDEENTYKRNLKNMINFNSQQSSSIKQRPKKKVQTDVYKKLEIKQEQQDGFTKQLRKMQEDKTTKQINEKKAKDIQQNIINEKLKEKKKQKQQKFSFDYNGSQIKVRNQSKNNLISKYINQNLNSNTKTVKQAFNDKNPTTVDSIVKNQKKNSQNGLKRKDDVFFSENISLSEGVTVGSGIKYTYQGKTLQSKVKNYSTVELKKQMHQRRLSKEQFMRVKSLNGSGMSILNIAQQSFRETKLKKAISVQDINKFKEKKQKTQKIIVNNQNLKKQLLLKIHEYQQKSKEPENPEKQSIQLGFIDVFNMNYLKSGGISKSQSNGKLSTRQSSYLPKIVHTSRETHLVPKQRERIKEISFIRSELRKRFDDKLRL